jgi:ribosomal protein S18 acetylase RimI-like enzyme
MKIEQANPINSHEIDFLTQKINEETPEFGLSQPFAFFIRNDNGEIIAGCNGFVVYGCLHTDQLWVHPNYRRQGLATNLLNHAHEHGRRSECSIATIITMSFQKARGLYEKLGYEIDHERQGYTNGSSVISLKKTLSSAEFNGMRVNFCTHDVEWEKAKIFRQKYFFDKAGIVDPYTWTFDHADHVHFIIYMSTTIVGYAHIQLWPEKRAAMRIIVIDEPYRKRGFGDHLLMNCEKWLSAQAYKSLHIESSLSALAFYKKHGYMEMQFNDPELHESDPSDVQIGKILNV